MQAAGRVCAEGDQVPHRLHMAVDSGRVKGNDPLASLLLEDGAAADQEPQHFQMAFGCSKVCGGKGQVALLFHVRPCLAEDLRHANVAVEGRDNEGRGTVQVRTVVLTVSEPDQPQKIVHCSARSAERGQALHVPQLVGAAAHQEELLHEAGMALGGGRVQGLHAPLTGERRPPARDEQRAQGLEVSAGNGGVHGSGAVPGSAPLVRPGIAQMLHGIRSTSLGGDVQGREATAVRYLEGGAVPEEAPHDREVAPARGHGKGNSARLPARVVDGGAGLAQDRSDLRATVETGHRQRSDALGVRRRWGTGQGLVRGKVALQALVELFE
mmetsp:Transcript_45576/g.136224  ORF Transcript_45576/g.136224 Transcript_45576/m.136224 type:complete len:326 (-) Transcript_45576:659-1636(-)